MYGTVWRRLPGPWPVKMLLALLLVVAVVAICFLWLFPAIATHLPFNDNSVETGLSHPTHITSAKPIL
jgi:hypothetical protein